jgi:hypothetical protein
MIAQEAGNYCFPKGFAFDLNYKAKANLKKDKFFRHLEKYLNKLLSIEPNDHTFLMMGCDYAFTNAQLDYNFMDSMIKRWNKKHPKVQMVYSTP